MQIANSVKQVFALQQLVYSKKGVGFASLQQAVRALTPAQFEQYVALTSLGNHLSRVFYCITH